MNPIDTEMHTSTPRMRRFLRHLGESSENLRQNKRLEKRKNFVEKIGSLTEEPSIMHEDFLKSDAKNIESQIRRALNLEQNLFERQKEDESRLSELREVEQKLFENQRRDEVALKKEDSNVTQLRDEVSNFRQKITSTQKFDEQALRQNSERIDQISEMMSKLNEKLEELSRIKDEVQGRAQKIETKIQKQTEAPVEKELSQPQQRVFLVKRKDIPLMPKTEEPKEIEQITVNEEKVRKKDLKKHLTLLTKHHAKMVKAGYHSETDLARLQKKIDKLRKKLK
jgi:DNA repair ATPase RecN